MKSADARLHAAGMFQTTAMRRRAFTSSVMRVRLEWIPEEDQQLDLALRDLGADLLVASQRPALQLVDGKSDLFFEQLASRAGGKQLVLRQERAD